MYATKRRLIVLARKGQLKARTDLPRKQPGARKDRFVLLEAERTKTAQPSAAGAGAVADGG
jgi:hypothetical protein